MASGSSRAKRSLGFTGTNFLFFFHFRTEFRHYFLRGGSHLKKKCPMAFYGIYVDLRDFHGVTVFTWIYGIYVDLLDFH